MHMSLWWSVSSNDGSGSPGLQSTFIEVASLKRANSLARDSIQRTRLHEYRTVESRLAEYGKFCSNRAHTSFAFYFAHHSCRRCCIDDDSMSTIRLLVLDTNVSPLVCVEHIQLAIICVSAMSKNCSMTQWFTQILQLRAIWA
jgi:hypothetical protein